MKLKFTALVLSVCLLLCGCASLLERSYSSVEPYTDRYWDSGAEDTLKAESYQDLVNSLLMLIEQRSEEVVIRYYAPEEANTYAQAVSAKHEVQNETLLGSYLLDNLTLAYTSNNGYCTLTYSMSYRTDAQDISTLMALSDTQSLVDLLRVAVREEHDSVTAQFISKLSREEILTAVEDLWQELYLAELEASGYFNPPPEDSGEDSPDTATEESPLDGGEQDEETTSDDSETDNPAELSEELPIEPTENAPPIVFPPCQWEILFYPNANTAEIVTIILK